MAEEITLARIVQAGVVPIDTGAVAGELQKTWNRLLMESYAKAQEVEKQHEQLDSQRAA
jgi:hypothetical protein